MDPTAGPEEAVLTWTTAARMAAERLTYPELPVPMYRLKADAGTLVLALRNVLRGAEWLNNASGGRDTYAPALGRFHRLLPNLLAARNVLEHFDEYAVGMGRMQRSSGGSSGPVPSYGVTFDFNGGAVTCIKIGPLTIDVADAYDACNLLLAFIYSRYLIDDAAPHIKIPRPGAYR